MTSWHTPASPSTSAIPLSAVPSSTAGCASATWCSAASTASSPTPRSGGAPRRDFRCQGGLSPAETGKGPGWRRGRECVTSATWTAPADFKGGLGIYDVSNPAKPKLVSSYNTYPPFPWPTHTCLALPFPVQNRRIMLVAGEDAGRAHDFFPSFLWVYDITDEKHPTAFASYQVDGVDGTPQPEFTGVHQPSEVFTGAEIPVAWFACGLRVLDFANPHAPKEVAWYMPDPAPGQGDTGRVQSNDVTLDSRGLIYLLDRIRGCHILERV